MGNGLLNIGLTGVRAAQLGLATTEHNITNVNTAGYNRQRTQQTTMTPNGTGSGYVGQGTEVATIRRMYNEFLTTRLNQAQAMASEMNAQSGQVNQLDNMLADPNAGLSPALQEFFKGVNDVAANPSLISARQAMIAAAQVLAQRFDSMSQRVSDLQASVNGEISTAAEQINIFARQIADLNGQIRLAESASNHPPNDLLDQRDQAVSELSKYIGNSIVKASDGSYSVFIGSGQPLVLGAQASTLAAVPSSLDASKTTVTLRSPAGSLLSLREEEISGGSLGGVLKFRSQALNGATDTLDQIAYSVALTFNAQQAMGQDLLGNSNLAGAATGFQSNLFNLTGKMYNTASPIQAPASGGSYAWETTESGIRVGILSPSVDSLTGGYYTNLRASDYRLEKTASGYQMTRLSDSTVFSGATEVALNAALESEGFQLLNTNLTGLAVGTSLDIRPTRGGAAALEVNLQISGDPRRIAAASPLVAGAQSTNLGSMKISSGNVGSAFTTLGASLPLTMTYGAGNVFTLSTGQTFRATYSDGSVSAVTTGTSVAFQSGSAVLTKLEFLGTTAGNPLAFAVDVSGTPSPTAPDVFTISRNAGGAAGSTGVSDGRNAVKFSKLQTQNTMNGQGGAGLATFQSAYAGLVGGIGALASQAKVSGAALDAMLEQNQAARDSQSAVNLDEEAANLIKYQQAYQAAAKAISIASSLFDSILAIRA